MWNDEAPDSEPVERGMRRLRRLTFVPRWVVMPVLRRQSVAEHSFGVAVLARWLCTMHVDTSDGFRLNVLSLALDHDVMEAVYGDAPSPTSQGKRRTPDTLNQVEIVVKCADILEATQFIEEEQAMGNQHGLDRVRNELITRFHAYWNHFEWKQRGAARRKPLSSDILSAARQFAVSKRLPHPVCEDFPANEI